MSPAPGRVARGSVRGAIIALRHDGPRRMGDDPTYNAQYQRIVEGLRKAGVPERETADELSGARRRALVA
jgi:hypothetical protein